MEYNHVHHMCVNATDCGAIHTGRDWTARGNVIRYNHIHHTEKLAPGADVRGVMLDDEFSSVTIEHNVFYQNNVQVLINGGRDNIIRYNVMYNSTDGELSVTGPGLLREPSTWLWQRLKAVPYTNALWSSRYPKLVNMTQPGAPAGNEIYDNIFYNDYVTSAIPIMFYGHPSIDKPQYYNVKNNFRSVSPTDFMSPDDADFWVRCAAAEWANAINFPQPIDVNHVGPRYPTGPTYMKKRAMTISGNHCYMTDYGCPTRSGPKPGHFYLDSWGEANVGALDSEEKCLARALPQWVFCGSDIDHPISSIYGPTGAMRIAGGGCWIKITNCPSDPKLTGFFYDKWGATTLNTDSDKNECFARAGYFWLHCGSHHDHPVTAFYRPKAVSKTVQ